MKIKLDDLKAVTHQALLKQGYSEKDAQTIGEILIYAQLRHNNQGVVKLIGGGVPDASANSMEIIKETKVSALIDAHQQNVMLVAAAATDIATSKAKEHGISIVGIKGANNSSGAIGYFARRIAKQNLVALIFTGTGLESVAPEGSYEALFGTNPIAIAVPAEAGPVVLDMATAAMAYFGVVEANTAGRKLPEDIAYDRHGNITDDPAAVLDEGALKPFGNSRKGSHLSMMVQLLAGPLIGSEFMGGKDVSNNWAGHLIIAIDPEILGGTEYMRAQVSAMVKKVKNAKKLSGVDEIFVPGEHGDRLAELAEQAGELEIEDNLWRDVQNVAKS